MIRPGRAALAWFVLATLLATAAHSDLSAQSLCDEAWSSFDELTPEHAPSTSPRIGSGYQVLEGFLDGTQTGTGFGEDYLLGVPGDLQPGDVRPLLLAWHGYGSPPRQIVRDTDYVAECAARGWFLLAPRGLDDKSFAFPPAQRNVRAVLEEVCAHYPIDPLRLYGVGWSMGAQSVLNFAARHRGQQCIDFAAVAALQGPHDVRDTYVQESVELRAWLERLFAITPQLDERPYVRVSSVRLDAARVLLQSEPSLATHLLDLPLLLVYAPDDELSYLLAQNQALGAYLRARNAPITEWSVRGRVPAHSWRVVSAHAVCDWLDGHRASPTPSSFDVVSDGEATRGGVRLVPQERRAFATAEVMRRATHWKLHRLRDAEVVCVDVSRHTAESSAVPIHIELLRANTRVERLEVRGLDRRPEEVRRSGRRWDQFSWDPNAGLEIDVPHRRTRWQIVPGVDPRGN